MSMIDHVSELRVELAGSILTPQERAMLEAELAAALAALTSTSTAPSETEAA